MLPYVSTLVPSSNPIDRRANPAEPREVMMPVLIPRKPRCSKKTNIPPAGPPPFLACGCGSVPGHYSLWPLLERCRSGDAGTRTSHSERQRGGYLREPYTEIGGHGCRRVRLHPFLRTRRADGNFFHWQFADLGAGGLQPHIDVAYTDRAGLRVSGVRLFSAGNRISFQHHPGN